MNRGYQGIYTMYRFSRNSDKYIIRMYSKTLYNAVRRNKNKHSDFKKYIDENNEFKTRIVKIVLNTGEIEHLATNLSKKETTVEELAKLILSLLCVKSFWKIDDI